MKQNNAFSADNVIHISDKIHRYRKYTDNDYEYDEPIHYEPGYGVNSYSTDESIIQENKRKKETKEKCYQKSFKCKTSKNYLRLKYI